MEKLIKLLNKYDDKLVGEYHWEIEGEDILAYSKFWGGYETINVAESIIISKWYEFVEWLVENEKIEYRKIIEKEIEVGFKLVRIKDYPNKIMEEDVEELLMLLSIQDEPIEFLVSILK